MGAKAKRWVPFRGAVETTHSWSSVIKSRHTSHSIIIDHICTKYNIERAENVAAASCEYSVLAWTE